MVYLPVVRRRILTAPIEKAAFHLKTLSLASCHERRAGGAGEHRLDVQLDVALEERLLRLDVGGGDRGVGGHCARCLRGVASQ